jgi:trehalose 6-phosphate synthase/phosphatase
VVNLRLPAAPQTVLIQVSLQTTGENELQGGVADVVSRINSRFSTLTYQPVVFLHTQDLTFNQYLALLTVADTFMVSSLREGMALRSHEYVECQEERKRPLILSEVSVDFISHAHKLDCLPLLGTVHGNLLVQWLPLVHPNQPLG